ncbi:MAG: hypothetical protein DWQ05_05435 [Calditrichaeota bacterium]|nr:MAG: hypothetical protein DWQ05_05435 [Calditrichota bacterium]
MKLILSFLLFFSVCQAQEHRIAALNGQADILAQTQLQSNGIVDIVAAGDRIWLATGTGLSVTTDGGENFQTFTQADGLGRGEITALTVRQFDEISLIIVATAFDTVVAEGNLPVGGGIAYSLDFGESWVHSEQPGLTPIQNVTFDISIHDDKSVWITSWGGGTRRGTGWEYGLPLIFEKNPADEFIHDPLCNLNHRAFSSESANGVLWIGTAGAINKSLDDGETWMNITHQNQENPISGNFVVAIDVQNVGDDEYIWAATRLVTDTTEASCSRLLFPGSAGQFNGLSVSNDGGFSWHTALDDKRIHNFAFDGATVYAAADEGLFKSIDFGQTWAEFPPIVDATKDVQFLSERIFSIAISADRTLWVGSPDGLAVSKNEGISWDIIRGSVKTGQGGEPRTYAYPSPFSHTRHNQLGGSGYLRFQYNTKDNTQVTLRIYDFAMDLVKEVVSGKSRAAGEFYEVWNGYNEHGELAANGVYFYSVELDGDGVYWGKFIVME